MDKIVKAEAILVNEFERKENLTFISSFVPNNESILLREKNACNLERRSRIGIGDKRQSIQKT